MYKTAGASSKLACWVAVVVVGVQECWCHTRVSTLEVAGVVGVQEYWSCIQVGMLDGGSIGWCTRLLVLHPSLSIKGVQLVQEQIKTNSLEKIINDW